MDKKTTSIALLSIMLIACNNKAPYVPDYEIATGLVIGPEKCRANASENAWLIQFSGPNPANRSYGGTIAYNGKSYANVVKTYLLPDSAKVSGKKYCFEFYLDGKSAQQGCEVADPMTFDVPRIRPKSIGRIAN